MRSIGVAVAGVLLAGSAAAEPPGETPPAPEHHKSLLRAYAISWAATALPIAAGALIDVDSAERGWRPPVGGVIGLAGLVIGPSAGNWYAGEGLTTGLVLRLGGTAAVVTLAVADPHLDHPATVMGLLGAAALWETGLVWDLATLPRAIRRANHRIVAPMFTGTGFAVAGTF
jgi:hypothetical protein